MSTPSTELIIVPGIEANKLALITPESASAVKAAYLPHFTAFLELEKAAQNVAVNRPKEARIVRLDLRKVRVAAERARKELGVEAKNYKECVDQVYNLLEDRLKPVEEKMRAIEEADKRAEAERVAKIKEARIAELTPFALLTNTSIEFYDLANMPEGQYIALRDSTKAAAEAKIAADKKAEQDRIAVEAAKEAERIRLAEENKRLAAEAAERQRALDKANRKAEEERKKAVAEAERLRKENEAKLAAERKANEEKLAKERAVREAAEKAERIKREKEAAELAAKVVREKAEMEAKAKIERDRLAAEAERARLEAKRLADAEAFRVAKEAEEKAKQVEAARKAASAPDKERILSYAKAIESVNPPVLSTSKELNKLINEQSIKFVRWLRSEAGKL